MKDINATITVLLPATHAQDITDNSWGLGVLSSDLTTNETVLFSIWIVIIFVVLPVLSATGAWLTARLVYSRHDSELAIDHYRLRKYACRSCGHGYGHHIDGTGKSIGCVEGQAMISPGCGCHCYIGATPPDSLTPHKITSIESVSV